MLDEDWWPLSAAFTWISIRKPLRFEEWDDTVFPASPASQCLVFGKSVSRAATRSLAALDDGVTDALRRVERELLAAAASGRIKVRGRRVQGSDPVLEMVSPEEFTREATALFPATEAMGPGEQPNDVAAFPRWREVQVLAAQLRSVWPQDDGLARAVRWLKQHGRGVKKQDEPAVMAAEDVSRELARRAFDEVFGRPSTRGRRPKGA